MEDYLAHVRATVSSVADLFPPEALDESVDLIEHGEPAEGMCYLAWAIVNHRVMVPSQVIAAVRELSAELVDEAHMPRDLDDFALPDR